MCTECKHIREKLLNTDKNEHKFYIRLDLVVILVTNALNKYFDLIYIQTHVCDVSIGK